MRRVTKTETLSEYLARWAEQQQLYAPSPRDVAAARLTRLAWHEQLYGNSSPAFRRAREMGINFNLADGRKFNWDLDILKTAQGRATVREVLPKLIQAARSDPKHPYNDTRNPGHDSAVVEMQQAYR